MLAALQPLVLSIATCDYAEKWLFCLDSQRDYCSKNNFEHQVIDPTGVSELHPKWSKLKIAHDQLVDDRNILLIDADAEISKNCPPFTDVLSASPSHDVFFVRGISGRPNSGVLILRGGKQSAATRLMKDCLDSRCNPVPKEDFVTTEGENGHVIMHLKKDYFVQKSFEMDRAWNCSIPEQADAAFVRHYTNHLRKHLFARQFAPKPDLRTPPI